MTGLASRLDGDSQGVMVQARVGVVAVVLGWAGVVAVILQVLGIGVTVFACAYLEGMYGHGSDSPSVGSDML